MANWRSRTATPSYGNLVSCTCAEYIIQVPGDPTLHEIFTRNWNAVVSASTPKSKRWIEMWNGTCGASQEKAPPVAVEHADAY